MGTHCYIAEEKDNDMYRSIYCHLDGYPEEVGKLLVKYYDTTENFASCWLWAMSTACKKS